MDPKKVRSGVTTEAVLIKPVVIQHFKFDIPFGLAKLQHRMN